MIDSPLRVGILSMQRVVNYGSFLQAYALRELVRANAPGGNVRISFVDIIPGRRILPEKSESRLGHLARVFLSELFSGKLRQRLRDHRLVGRLRETITSSWPVLELDSPADSAFDLVVIGSDEVFNCCQPGPFGFSRQLFGDFAPDVTRRAISYAASFGHTTMSDLRHYSIDSEVAESMKTLGAISVRDKNSAEIVKELTGIAPEENLDPVLIYGYKNEIEQARRNLPQEPPYMIVYTYGGRIRDKKEISQIKQFAKRHGLKIYTVFCDYTWADRLIVPDTPLDVLRWFCGAQFIVTDTFHGTIFSIITHSRFATIIRPSNRNKLTSLLSDCGLPERSFDGENSSLDALYDLPVDYSAVEQKLAAHREKANDYLKRNLSQDNK